MSGKKNIVVAGAGFGGIIASLKLAKKLKRRVGQDYQLILIDRNEHQLYTPALYEIAAIPREYNPCDELKSAILIPIQDIIKDKPIEFIKDEVVGLDSANRKLFLGKKGIVDFEYLIIALGVETNYFGIPGLQTTSFSLKNFNDAVRLRDAVEDYFKKKKDLKIIIGGGGATGVELAAELVNFIRSLQMEYPKNNEERTYKIILIEASPEILPGFAYSVVKKAKQRLQNLGIEILTNSPIKSATSTSVITDRRQETYDILIWTGGVRGSAVLEKLNLPLSSKGTVQVDEYLCADKEKRIYVVGDSAFFINPKTGKSLNGNVPVAEGEAKIAAKNILRSIRGKPRKKFVPLKKYPFILAVGGKYAIADLVYIRFSGFWGWFTKQLVELRYFLTILPIKKAIQLWFYCCRVYSSND